MSHLPPNTRRIIRVTSGQSSRSNEHEDVLMRRRIAVARSQHPVVRVWHACVHMLRRPNIQPFATPGDCEDVRNKVDIPRAVLLPVIHDDNPLTHRFPDFQAQILKMGGTSAKAAEVQFAQVGHSHSPTYLASLTNGVWQRSLIQIGSGAHSYSFQN